MNKNDTTGKFTQSDLTKARFEEAVNKALEILADNKCNNTSMITSNAASTLFSGTDYTKATKVPKKGKSRRKAYGNHKAKVIKIRRKRNKNARKARRAQW